MPSVTHPVPLAPPPSPIPSQAYRSINTRMDQIGNNQRDALSSVANIVPEGCIAAFANNQKKLLLRLAKQSLAALSVQRAAYCPLPPQRCYCSPEPSVSRVCPGSAVRWFKDL